MTQNDDDGLLLYYYNKIRKSDVEKEIRMKEIKQTKTEIQKKHQRNVLKQSNITTVDEFLLSSWSRFKSTHMYT